MPVVSLLFLTNFFMYFFHKYSVRKPTLFRTFLLYTTIGCFASVGSKQSVAEDSTTLAWVFYEHENFISGIAYYFKPFSLATWLTSLIMSS